MAATTTIPKTTAAKIRVGDDAYEDPRRGGRPRGTTGAPTTTARRRRATPPSPPPRSRSRSSPGAACAYGDCARSRGLAPRGRSRLATGPTPPARPDVPPRRRRRYSGGGGDDVHDYDRPEADEARDYDWHDDGFLPPPFSCHRRADGGDRQSSSPREGSPPPPPSCILRDCLYRPQRPTDPPSSKFERCAWTRDWIRDERVVSLDLEDYRSREREVGGYDVGDYELLCAEEEEAGRREETAADDDEDGDERSDDDGGTGGDNVSLNISPAELAEEEGFLLDVMLAGGGGAVFSASRSVYPSSGGYYSGCPYDPNASSAPSGGKRVSSVKERRKKKRQRKLAARRARLADDDAARIDRISPPAPQRSFFTAREGFLLLLHEEDGGSNGGLEIIRGHTEDAAASARDHKVEAVRVFARLHPSGWLSIEDRSIRRRGDCGGDRDRDEDHDENESTNERQRQRRRHLTRPLPPRTRYLDFYIDPDTTCSPWVRGGTTSFHFRLTDVLFLGASSLNNRSFDIGSVDDNSIAANDAATSSTAERAHLLFRIDEGTGGDFADGFEWVNCITGVEFPANE